MSFTIRSLEDRIVFDAAPAVAAEAEPAPEAEAADRILIVDRAVDNAGELADAVLDGVTVVEYDSRTDTLADLKALLEAARGDGEYASIAFAGHGEAGRYVVTADATLETGALEGNAELAAFLAYLGELLAEDGRIDLLGCDIAAGDGMALIDALEELTGIDFAASDDATGNETEGGDWFLETDDIDLLATYFDAEGIEAFQGLLANLYYDDVIYATIPDHITAVEGESIFGGFDFTKILATDVPSGSDAPVISWATLTLSFTSLTSDLPVSILEAMGITRLDTPPPVPTDNPTGIPGQLSYYGTDGSVYNLYSNGVFVGTIDGANYANMTVNFTLDASGPPPSYDLSLLEAFLGSIQMTLPAGEYLLNVDCNVNGTSSGAQSSVTIVRETTNNNDNEQNPDDKTGDGDGGPGDDNGDGEGETDGDDNGDGWVEIDDTDEGDTDNDTGNGDDNGGAEGGGDDTDNQELQEALDNLNDILGGFTEAELEELEATDLWENMSGLQDGLGDLDSWIDSLLADLGEEDAALAEWLGGLSGISAQLKQNGILAAGILADAVKAWRSSDPEMRDGMARDLVSGMNAYLAAINVRIKSALFSLQTLTDLMAKNKAEGQNIPAEQLLALVEEARAEWEAALAASMEMRDRMYFDLKDAAAMRGQ